MKRNHSKAIVATVAALAGTQVALAQYDPGCWPINTTTGPSPTYNLYTLTTLLFGCSVGISGTDTYSDTNNQIGDPFCYKGALNLGGRFGFYTGQLGSVQSTVDDNLSLTYGAPLATGQSCGFFIVTTGALPNITENNFDSPSTAFFGASNRYFQIEKVVANVDTTLRVDVVADTARFHWTMTNTATTATSVGLMSGSWVYAASSQPGDRNITYVYSPGYKPFLTEQEFQNGNALEPFPAAMTFALNQSDAYGLEVINSPLTAPNIYGITASDQTQVDDFVIGQAWDVLNHDVLPLTVTEPKPPYPYIINTDVSMVEYSLSAGGGFVDSGANNGPAFLQFWHPISLAPGATRNVVSYYRSTWGVSDYTLPFAAVIDTPLVITTSQSSPNTFTNGTFDFRVYLDNVGGYATAGQSVPLTNTKIQVNLPQGMVDATNPNSPTANTLVAYVPNVSPETMGFQDFSVQVNPNTAPGPNTYSVQINSPTGASKTMYGTINVAATPNLQILQAANLVGTPWNFSTSDWATVLGLTPNTNFQAFQWNPLLNQYVISTNAVRGQGVFIVAQNDFGTISLGGTPTEDPNTITTDIVNQTSAQSITLNPGWNLIANPFNYTLSLGQLLGIDQNSPNQVLTFANLIGSNLISPAFAFYDPASQGYEYISQTSDLLLPNRGYWVFNSSSDNINLIFPYILAPFVRSTTAPWKQSETNWRLQIQAQNGKSADTQNYLGVASAAVSKVMTSRKPPMAPVPNAVSVSIQDTVNGKVTSLAQSLRSAGGNTQSWNVQVTSKAGGATTLNWPNISTVPSDVQFQLTDQSTGATRDIRRGSGYTFTATPGAIRSFTISAVPGAGSRAVISNIAASYNSRAAGSGVAISYVLASSATVSVSILQNGRVIYQAVQGRAALAGTNTASWNLRDAANRKVAPGLYQIQVTAEGANGDRVYRTIPVTITR